MTNNSSKNSSEPDAPASSFDRLMKNVQPKLVKTLLDREESKAVMDEIKARQAEQTNIVKETRQSIEPITDFKASAPCKLAWEQMKGSGDVRQCLECQLFVYDFSSKDLGEARDVILKKEGKRDTILYKREDGKFMTSNCPSGAKPDNRILMIVSLLLLLLVCLLALLILNARSSI